MIVQVQEAIKFVKGSLPFEYMSQNGDSHMSFLLVLWLLGASEVPAHPFGCGGLRQASNTGHHHYTTVDGNQEEKK